jgi:hypothetical protein
MDMVFLAKDNEYHKVDVQYMNYLLLLLLSNHFYLKQLMEPIYNHLNIDLLDNKPKTKYETIQILRTSKV